MNQFTFNVNNGGIFTATQEKHDGKIILSDNTIIPAGDMIMLFNYYRYIKNNNIQNDFINPTGTNKE